jgi:hypothetical protein
MHNAKINLDSFQRSRWNVLLTSRDAKFKSRGFQILESREVNITFQRLLLNDQN